MNIALGSPDSNGTVAATNRGESEVKSLTIAIDGQGAERVAKDTFDLAAGESKPVALLSRGQGEAVQRVTVNVHHDDRVVASKIFPIPFTLDHD